MKTIPPFIACLGALCVLAVPTQAQTNAIPTSGSFAQTAFSWVTSPNPEFAGTFSTNNGDAWTGVDSIQGGPVSLANELGLDYKIWKQVAVESVTRNSGIAGTLVSQQLGLNLSFVIVDTKLTLYGDGGYEFADFPGAVVQPKTRDRLYGEFGLRVAKALTLHTYTQIGIGVQLPKSAQVFMAAVGFTF